MSRTAITINVSAAGNLLTVPSVDDNDPPFVATADSANSALNVTLKPAAVTLLSATDNRGERELMVHLLKAFRQLLHPESTALTDNVRTR